MISFRWRTLWPLLIVLGLLACTPITPPVITPVPTPPATGPSGAPWWTEAVFYQIFVRSFYDSDGDGIGDFNGITAKLDYLNDGDANTTDDLGVTALWLMPLHPSPSYHGYDVTDFYTTNPDYGTPADLRRLLNEAHRRGIRVTIDFVINHTSRQHPWFQQALDPQSPRHDWYVWSDHDPRVTGPWGQQVWHRAANGQFYYGVFWEGMPDLNYENPAVALEMEKVVRFWLRDMGVDGLRIDGARYVDEDGAVLADSAGNHDRFRRLRQVVKGSNPNAMTVAEVWTLSDVVASYAQGDQFDLLFNFDLAGALVASARENRADAARLGLAISLALLPRQHTANFLTNHDQNRVMSELGGDVNKAKRAATLLLTAPGTPFLYYGEEIGLTGQKPDEDLRLPMPWSAAANAGFSSGAPWRAPVADYRSKNVAAHLADANSLLAHYRAAITVRQANSALRVGEGYKVKSVHPAVLPLLRASADQTVLVVTNLSEAGVGDYRLTMDAGPLTPGATYTATPIWGQGPINGVTATGAGGFAEYQPTRSLNPGETLIVELSR